MEFIIFFAIVIGIIVFIVKLIVGIVYKIRRSASFERMSSYILNKLKEIDYSKNFICFDDTGYYNKALVIDDASKKICILNQANKKIKSKLYSFSEVVSSQISENGTTVTETSLDNAIVGGVLFGKTGAVVGGLTGRKSTSNRVNDISLNIIINDKKDPFHKFIFARCPGEGMSKTDKVYLKGLNDINHWHSILCLIIEENKKKYQNKNYASSESDKRVFRDNNLNIADELFKLAELMEKGILTADEFQMQKQKLLLNSYANMETKEDEIENKKKTEYNVVLKDSGNKKIEIIRLVREITGFGLKEAKDLVENLPQKIVENVTKDKAASIEAALKEAGADVEII